MKKKEDASIAELGNMAARAVSVHYMLITVIVCQVLILWLSSSVNLFPGEERITGIVGTCAEVIAGLYGITLAGYTFFLSRIDGLCATDTTLDYVVASVKNRFKHLIWYITITVAVTLATSLVVMYYPASSEVIPEYWYRLLCNEFLLFLCFSVGLILYYSLKVIDPNCLSKEATKLKKRLCTKFGPNGSAAEFIALYDKIETLCNRCIPKAVLQQLYDNKGKRFEYTLELLFEIRPDLRLFLPELHRIHRYYECTVNCAPLQVKQEMCVAARRVAAVLEKNVPATEISS